MLCFVFAALVVLLDQFIKRWILLTIELHERMDLIPGIVGLTYVRNTGAAFSILSDQRWLLVGISIAVILFIIAVLLRYNDGFWGTLGLAAALGGAIGNLVDRLMYGYVVDIFEFQFMNFAIFNIADVFITLGALTFIIYFIVSSIRPKERTEVTYDSDTPEFSSSPPPVVEDQIGLYDFQYNDSSERDAYGRNSLYDTDYSSAPAVYASPADSSSSAEAVQGIGSDSYSDQDFSSALSALSELEIELEGISELDDYDVDELLKEYGFEDSDSEF